MFKKSSLHGEIQVSGNTIFFAELSYEVDTKFLSEVGRSKSICESEPSVLIFLWATISTAMVQCPSNHFPTQLVMTDIE